VYTAYRPDGVPSAQGGAHLFCHPGIAGSNFWFQIDEFPASLFIPQFVRLIEFRLLRWLSTDPRNFSR
jgi:hypothetical protein